eukprot:15472226-Alexandrium_andersonii.AAC.1
MHDLLAKAWPPILNCFQGDEQRWGRFLEYCGEDIPRVQAPDLPELSGHTVWQALQRRGDHKAGGLDGWRSAEAKDLPPCIC